MLVHPGLPQRYVASTHLYTLPCNKACQAQEGRGEEERVGKRRSWGITQLSATTPLVLHIACDAQQVKTGVETR